MRLRENENRYYTVDRITSVKCEIDGAIESVMVLGNIVAAHVLIWAAIDVLRGVAKSRNMSTTDIQTDALVPPGKLNQYRTVRRGSYNYFKHADVDPDGVTHLSSEYTLFMIFFTCLDFIRVFDTMSVRMMFYMRFFLSRYPELVKLSPNLPAMDIEPEDGEMDVARDNYLHYLSLLPEMLQSREKFGLGDALF